MGLVGLMGLEVDVTVFAVDKWVQAEKKPSLRIFIQFYFGFFLTKSTNEKHHFLLTKTSKHLHHLANSFGITYKNWFQFSLVC